MLISSVETSTAAHSPCASSFCAPPATSTPPPTGASFSAPPRRPPEEAYTACAATTRSHAPCSPTTADARSKAAQPAFSLCALFQSASFLALQRTALQGKDVVLEERRE